MNECKVMIEKVNQMRSSFEKEPSRKREQGKRKDRKEDLNVLISKVLNEQIDNAKCEKKKKVEFATKNEANDCNNFEHLIITSRGSDDSDDSWNGGATTENYILNKNYITKNNLFNNEIFTVSNVESSIPKSVHRHKTQNY